MLILGISGKRRSGKTLLANMLATEYDYKHLSLADPLKKLCKEHFKLTEDQVNGKDKELPTQYIYTPRQIMIDTGKFYRSIDPNFWIDKLATSILSTAHCQSHKYVISDIRFPNEADWVKEHGGYLVRLERAVELTGEPINDPSETSLDNYNGFDLRFPESWNVDLVDMQEIAAKVVANVSYWQEQLVG